MYTQSIFQKNHYESGKQQLDIKTVNETVSDTNNKIRVKTWNEARKLELNEPLKLLRWDKWAEYYENKYEVQNGEPY